MPHLTLELLKHRLCLLGTSTLHALKNKILSEWSAMQRFCSTSSRLLLVSADSGNDIALPVHFQRRADYRAEVIELADKGNVLRAETSSRVELCP